MAGGQTLDAKSIDALRKLLRKSASAPVAPPNSPVRLRTREAPVPGLIRVSLAKDGGTDGDAPSATAATWTYTLTNALTGTVLAREVPLYTHRAWATKTTPGTYGIAFFSSSNSDTGAASTYGAPPDGSSGSGSSGDSQPWRLFWCDEQFPLVACASSSSGGGS